MLANQLSRAHPASLRCSPSRCHLRILCRPPPGPGPPACMCAGALCTVCLDCLSRCPFPVASHPSSPSHPMLIPARLRRLMSNPSFLVYVTGPTSGVDIRPGARSAERCVRPVRVKQRAETLLGMPGCWMYLGIRGCSICRSPCLFPFFGGPLPTGLGPGPGPRPCLGSPTPEVHARRALSGLVSSLQVNFQSNQICSPTLATDRHLPLSALPHFPHSAIPTRIPFLSSSPTRLESSSQHPGAFAISHAANLLTQVLEHTHLLT